MIRSLKSEIIREIKDIGHPVGFNSVPDNTIFPHLILDYPTTTYLDGQYNIAMDVDIWDKAESTQVIDGIAEKLITKLNRLILVTDKFTAVIYLSTMGSVGSDDPTLRRKTLIFNIQLRSEEDGKM